MDKINLAMIADNLDVHGISIVIMNYCTKLNPDRFNISILAGAPINEEYRKTCSRLGINITELPSRKQSPKDFYKALYRELKANRYDIAHIHGNSATITIELFLAWLSKTKVRIAHSHNSTCSYMRAHKVLHPFFNMLYTHGFACSELAGKWLFGDKKFYVIPNGFETERFKFSRSGRDSIRRELGLSDDKFVLGHVGRFNDQKNHTFLLKIFRETARINPDAYLLLVGSGPDMDKIKALIQEHEYKDRIIVYGESNRTEDLYSAMDIFVFPSKHEGLGIVLIEAQISGLPCVASDAVPGEAMISHEFTFLPLENETKWAEVIDGYSKNISDRGNRYSENESSIMKYDIVSNAEYVSDLYIKFLSK